jgi:hypothetical protein
MPHEKTLLIADQANQPDQADQCQEKKAIDFMFNTRKAPGRVVGLRR